MNQPINRYEQILHYGNDKYEIIYNYAREDLTGLSVEEVMIFANWAQKEIKREFAEFRVTVEKITEFVGSLVYTDDDDNEGAVIGFCTGLLYRFRKFILPELKIRKEIDAAESERDTLQYALNSVVENKMRLLIKLSEFKRNIEKEFETEKARLKVIVEGEDK